MNRAIVSSATGDFHRRIAEITAPNQSAYARQLGASYFHVEPEPGLGPYWVKTRIAGLLAGQFDEVLWLDSDIIVRPDAPDLFRVAGGRFAAYAESDDACRFEVVQEFAERMAGLGIAKSNEEAWEHWDGLYFNMGLMVVPRSAAGVFSRPDPRITGIDGAEAVRFMHDQTWLNFRLKELHHPTRKLPMTYNLMKDPGAQLWDVRHEAAEFIHYAGLAGTMKDELLDLIRADLAEWR